MTEQEILCAIRSIHALKARYFRMVDAKDWAGLETVFAPNLVADFREASGGFDESQFTEGAAAFVAKLAPLLQHATTVHHGHMPEIEIEKPDLARGVWAMEDRLWFAEGSPLPMRWMHGYGHYHERYVRLSGHWHIKEIRLTRLRVDVG